MNINYTTIYFKGISLVMGISRQSLNTVFIGLVKFSSGILMYSALIHGVSSGKYLNTIVFHTFKMYRFYKPGCRIFVKLINMKTIFSQLLDETGDHIKYIRAAGTYTKVFQRYRDRCMVSCKFPTGIIKYLPFMTIITLGRNSNIKHKRCFLTKAGNNVKLGFKSKVRGVAMNPVDHPHGGRTKSNSPEKSP